MTVKLPPMPPQIAALPTDSRGYPVPRFTQWVLPPEKEGGDPVCVEWDHPGAQPDFRAMRAPFRKDCVVHGRCWVCGKPLGVHRVFAIGPMCVINRVTSEPPSCRSCAEWAVIACPFLVKPKMKRLPTDDYPEGFDQNPGGFSIDRNPGCVALYETHGKDYRPFDAGNGWLLKLGDPVRVDWWAEGRLATRAEIMASIDSGYPFLFDMARKEGQSAMTDLARMRAVAMRLLPAA